MRRFQRIIRAVQAGLTPDLLSPKWQKLQTDRPYSGHCYIGAEAVYHLVGGQAAGFTPMVMTHDTWPEGLDIGETHWFVRRGPAILDPTAEQFPTPVPYSLSKGSGFLTREPSRRARIVMERAKKVLENAARKA